VIGPTQLQTAIIVNLAPHKVCSLGHFFIYIITSHQVPQDSVITVNMEDVSIHSQVGSRALVTPTRAKEDKPVQHSVQTKNNVGFRVH